MAGRQIMTVALALLVSSFVMAQTPPGTPSGTPASTQQTTQVHTQVQTTAGTAVTVDVSVHQDLPSLDKPRVLAIFVKNRAGKPLDESLGAFEDLLASRLSDKGFSVLSREDVTRAVSKYTNSASLSAADADKLLEDNTSAIHLAQNMGADDLLIVSVTSFEKEIKDWQGYGAQSRFQISRLKAAMKIIDRERGASLAGDVVEASRQTLVTDNLKISSDDLPGLMDQAATRIAENLAGRTIPRPDTAAGMVDFSVYCGLGEMLVPDVVMDDKGQYVVRENQLRLTAANVLVELDGVAIGTAPGTFKVAPGLHKLRLSRDGCQEVSRTVAVTTGMKLNIDLQLDPAGYARWKDATSFLQELKAGAKLTDAQVERLRGIAQMFRQSGFKIDSNLSGVTLKSVW